MNDNTPYGLNYYTLGQYLHMPVSRSRVFPLCEPREFTARP